MRRGIHGTGRRCLQRIVANGGNRLFIKGGKVKVPIAAPHLTALQKAVLIAAILTPDLPEPPAAEPARRKVTRKGASDDV